MKLNNKGMAISGILYTILILFIVLIFGVLSVLASSKYSFDRFRSDIMERLNADQKIVDNIDSNLDEKKVCKVTFGDGTRIGDEITCDTETFYVYDTTEDSIKMLAKYNLEVGNNINSSYPANEETNLQSENALGYHSEHAIYGTVKFGDNNVYNDSIVKVYVDAYKEKLLEMEMEVEEARLITKDELESLGCDSSNMVCSAAPSFIIDTSYWTETATNMDTVWIVQSLDMFENIHYSYNEYFGVRPVIVIPKSSI